ncbi:cation:proton antiporter regulatory subunit [Caldisalinibacter kiritimatiensis]|uniref:Ribosomal protein S6 glutaminyl transferase n=1 Tax=Caldisalinibacter kiritimatiensis TaxID=1304284 RepID=R1AUB2_9FIRM|nr:TrkA C-terminal domain-containing protein [Caldisalinibacter kiritimatiensis]EOD00753.1 Ribosomal protein S6 glutaminyl transferase [Caldisalinibacter kiritimatiensis]
MGTIGAILLFIILLLIVEVFSIALKITGLDIDKARFQVISIITNTGFTTQESELITQHPTRRKIAQILMLISYVGYAALIALVLNILQSSNRFLYITITIIVIAFFVLMLIRYKWVSRSLEQLIEKQLLGKMKKKKSKTVEEVLKLNEEYGVVEFVIEEGSILVGKSLKELGLTKRNIQILNIDKGSKMIHFPKSNYVFVIGDKVNVYGNLDNIKSLVLNQYRKETVDN